MTNKTPSEELPELLFPISSKNFYMHIPQPRVELIARLEQEIAQWVHHEGSIWWPITPWVVTVPPYHQATSCSLLVHLPDAMIDALSEQLHRGLGTIHFLCRHVEVIHKDDRLLAHLWPIHTLPPLVQLGHDDVLSHVGTRLSWEVDKRWEISFLRQAVHQLVLDIHTLSCSSRTNEQQGSEDQTIKTLPARYLNRYMMHEI